MYLKVDNNGDEQLYSFENQKSVVIGRAPLSDIQLVTDGISRKHLEVIEKDGEFFVIDFGSTNGTFLNDDRLDPNVEHPFNSFFPLKLGFHVFLYLVDEVSPEQLKEAVISEMEASENARREEQKAQRKKKVQSSGTGTVKLKSSNSEGTNETIGLAGGSKEKVRKKFNPKKSRAKKEKEDKLNFPLYTGIFILVMAGLAYSQGYLDSFIKSEDVPVIAKPAVRKKPIVKALPKKAVSVIPKIEDIRSKMLLDKCLTDVEREFCQRISKSYERDFNEGFSVLLDSVYYVVDVDKLDFLYSKAQLTDDEKNELLDLASQTIGRRFNREKFVENNYKLDHFNFSNDYVLDLLITDFARGKYLGLLERHNLKELVFIAFKGNAIRDPFVYAQFDLKRLRVIRDNYELANRARFSIYAKEPAIFNKVLYNFKDFNKSEYLKYIKVFN